MIPTNRISTPPGEVLQEEFLVPLGISMSRLAMELHVPANRITDIVRGERAVTVDTAMRLGRYFGTGAEFWMNLQSMHDLTAGRAEHGREIEQQVRPLSRAAM